MFSLFMVKARTVCLGGLSEPPNVSDPLERKRTSELNLRTESLHGQNLKTLHDSRVDGSKLDRNPLTFPSSWKSGYWQPADTAFKDMRTWVQAIHNGRPVCWNLPSHIKQGITMLRAKGVHGWREWGLHPPPVSLPAFCTHPDPLQSFSEPGSTN